MPRDVVALVSADDFVSAVRVYADRANDMLRRSGVPVLEALEACETQALEMLDALGTEPETVIDLAGWWFGRLIELARGSEDVSALDGAEDATGILAGTAAESRVRDALGELPVAERTSVVLRDGYDLPEQAVGVALQVAGATAAERTAAGRLDLIAAYGGRPAPDLTGHVGRTTVDLVALSRLADGTLESPRAAPLRRHLGNCAACEEVLESLARARRLAAGLPIIAMDDAARESLIDRVATRAGELLPSHDAVLRTMEQDHDPGPAISPVIAVVVLVLALSLGIAVALLTSNHTSTRTPQPITPGPATSGPATSSPATSSPAAAGPMSVPRPSRASTAALRPAASGPAQIAPWRGRSVAVQHAGDEKGKLE